MSSTEAKPIALILFKANYLSDLNSIINSTITVQVYDDLDPCIHYISTSQPNDILFLILRKLNTLEILPKINHLRQLDSIFIIGDDSDTDNDELTSLEQYSKIIGYFSEKCISHLTESIEKNIDLCRKQIESFKFYDQCQKSTRQLSEEQGSFLWLQLFKQVLLQLPHDDEAKEEMIEKLQEYYHNNNKQLKLIKKFQETYNSKEALRWYAGQPFIYKQINRALRTEDIELLYKFRYFISDLCRAIDEKYAEVKEYELTLTLYRGVKMSQKEIDKLQLNIGKLISTNGFLSTTLSKDVALRFAGIDDKSEQSVLFEIKCDMAIVNYVRLASLRGFSEHFDEEEVLFDLDTVFELVSMETDAAHRNLINVHMIVSDGGRKTAQEYIDNVKKDISGSSTARIIFGRLLADIGQYDKCETYFAHLLKEQASGRHQQEDTAFLYYYLAVAKSYKGYYDQALHMYQLSYDMLMQASPPRLWPSAYVLNDMAVLFGNRGQYGAAMDYHKRAIKIREQVSDYRGQSTSLENIGIILRKQGDYDYSLECLMNCLKLRKEFYPEEHQQIASCLIHIADVYKDQDQLDLALEYEKKALKIHEQCLPVGHDKIATSLHFIGQTLYFQGRYDEALDYYVRALSIREKAFVTNNANGDHPSIATSLSNIGMMYYLKNQFTLALDYYHRALKIREEFGLMENEQTGSTLMKIGMVLSKQEKYEEALRYYRRSLTIKENIFPFGHFELVDCLTNMGNAYRDMENFDEAFWFFQKAKENVEHETDPTKINYIRLARLTDNMGIAIGRQDDEKKRMMGLEYRLEAVRILSKVYPRLNYAQWMETIGDACYYYNLWPKAIECYLTSLRMKEKCKPFNCKEVIKSLKTLGRLYVEKHDDGGEHQQYSDYILARMYYEKALVLMCETMTNSSNYASILNAIGSIYEKTLKYSLALEYYEKAFNILFTSVNSIQPEDDDDDVDLETVEMNVARIKWLVE